MALTKAQLVDMNANELILDLDGDTSLHASTDDQIDIKIGGADDFTFTANTFTALAGSTIAAQALTATTIGASGVVTANAFPPPFLLTNSVPVTIFPHWSEPPNCTLQFLFFQSQ